MQWKQFRRILIDGGVGGDLALKAVDTLLTTGAELKGILATHMSDFMSECNLCGREVRQAAVDGDYSVRVAPNQLDSVRREKYGTRNVARCRAKSRRKCDWIVTVGRAYRETGTTGSSEKENA